jgi:RNA polymerase sigma-70 factor, ECF subfamily
MERTTEQAARLKAGESRLRQQLLAGMGGDGVAYHQFLKDISAHLRAFLRRRLMAFPDDVEDLVQETVLALHTQRHTYRPDMPLTAWAHAIARYKLIDFLRARSSREALHDPMDDEMELVATSDTDAAMTRRDLNTLLATLPDHHRLPIVHVKLQGLSVAETAKITGMSESAVKVGVHRGLKALAAKLKADGLKD